MVKVFIGNEFNAHCYNYFLTEKLNGSSLFSAGLICEHKYNHLRKESLSWDSYDIFLKTLYSYTEPAAYSEKAHFLSICCSGEKKRNYKHL